MTTIYVGWSIEAVYLALVNVLDEGKAKVEGQRDEERRVERIDVGLVQAQRADRQRHKQELARPADPPGRRTITR
jgi:hypothetical protein